jgi:hypothetical protein
VDGTRVLSGGSPANGNFSGTGVTGVLFDPATSGAGIQLIVYTYIDAITNCFNSATDSIFVDVCSAVKGLSSKGDVRVYPNPANQNITIDLSNINETCTVELFTPEARRLTSWKLNGGTTHSTNISDYANGIYYLRISSRNSVNIIRMMKQE